MATRHLSISGGLTPAAGQHISISDRVVGTILIGHGLANHLIPVGITPKVLWEAVGWYSGDCCIGPAARRGTEGRWGPSPLADQTMSPGVVTSSSGQMGRCTFLYGISL